MPRGKRQWLRERCDYIRFHAETMNEYLKLMKAIIPESYTQHHAVIDILISSTEKQLEVIDTLKSMF